MYIGSFLRGSVVPVPFNTRNGTPATFGGTPRLRVLNSLDLSVVLADVVPAVDVNGVTGSNLALIDTDDPAFDDIDDFVVTVQAGSVEGSTVVGEQVALFSLNPGTLPTNAVSAAAVAADAVTKVQAGLATAAGVTAAVATVPTAAQNADALLERNQMGGDNTEPKVKTALAGGLFRFSINTDTGVMTVLNGDGSTAFTRTLTRAQVNAIISAAP